MADDDYERMRRTLDIISTECMGLVPESESHPVRHLDAMFAARPAMARKGLHMAIGDMVEMLEVSSPDYVARLDARLKEADAMTLTEARSAFSKQLKNIIKRGRIADEDGYYLVRNAAEIASEDQQAELWRLIADYEARVAN